MSFPLPNNILQLPDVAAKQILKKVVCMQNGDVSNAMQKMGYNYEINYGVAIPQLREIASGFKSDKALANQLREYSNIREALILSSMLDEPAKLKVSECLSICSHINNIELVEQFSRNLFAHNSNLFIFCKQIFTHSDICKIISFMSVGWSIKFRKILNVDDFIWLKKELENTEYIINQHIVHSIIFVMQAIVTNMTEYAKQINTMAENFSKSDNSTVAQFGREFLWLNAV